MTKKLTFSPIAIDLGAKNSGVYMPHYSYGDCLNDIKDKRAYTLTLNNLTLMMVDRTAARHQRRGYDRKQMSKRLTRLALMNGFNFDFDKHQEAISFLLNRRGRILGDDIDYDIFSSVPAELCQIATTRTWNKQLGEIFAPKDEGDDDAYDLTDNITTAIEKVYKDGKSEVQAICDALNDYSNLKSTKIGINKNIKSIRKDSSKTEDAIKEEEKKLNTKLSDIEKQLEKYNEISLNIFDFKHKYEEKIEATDEDTKEKQKYYAYVVWNILQVLQDTITNKETGHALREIYFQHLEKDLSIFKKGDESNIDHSPEAIDRRLARLVTDIYHCKSLGNSDDERLQGFINIIGNIANIQLRGLRKYFQDKKHQQGDAWLPKKLDKSYDSWLKSLRPKKEDKKKEIKKLISQLNSKKNKPLGDSTALALWLKTEPVKSIPPFEDQNNRRPPECRSLLLKPYKLDSILSEWREVVTSLVNYYQENDKGIYQQWIVTTEKEINKFGENKVKYAKLLLKNNPKKKQQQIDKDNCWGIVESSDAIASRSLQFILDLSRSDEQHISILRNIIDVDEKHNQLTKPLGEYVIKEYSTETWYKFKDFCTKYYKEISDSMAGRWFDENLDNLLTVCGEKTRNKKYQTDIDFGALFGLSPEQLSEIKGEQKVSDWLRGIRGMKTHAAKCAKLQKSHGNELEKDISIVRANEKIDAKLDSHEKHLIEMDSKSDKFALKIKESIQEKLPIELDHTKFNSVFTFAQISNIVFADRSGNAKNCPCCSHDNQGRMQRFDATSNALATRIRGYTARPIDGALRKLLDAKAREIAKLKLKQIIDNNSSEVKIPIITEQNKFDFEKNLSTAKGIRKDIKVTSPAQEFASKSTRIKHAGNNICPYSGEKLDNQGEIDHIISRSKSKRALQTVINSEANLIYVKSRANRDKNKTEYRLKDLDKKYLKSLFNTDEPGKITSHIHSTLGLTNSNSHDNPSYEELSKMKKNIPLFNNFSNFLRLKNIKEQVAFRHALFLEPKDPARRLVENALKTSYKAKVNGSQRYFASLIAKHINQQIEKQNLNLAVTYDYFEIPAENVHEYRKKDLEKIKPDTKKGSMQTKYSHVIDATLTFLGTTQRPEVINRKGNINRLGLDIGKVTDLIATGGKLTGELVSTGNYEQLAVPEDGGSYEPIEISRQKPNHKYFLHRAMHRSGSFYAQKYLPLIISKDKESPLCIGFNLDAECSAVIKGTDGLKYIRVALGLIDDSSNSLLHKLIIEAGISINQAENFKITQELSESFINTCQERLKSSDKDFLYINIKPRKAQEFLIDNINTSIAKPDDSFREIQQVLNSLSYRTGRVDVKGELQDLLVVKEEGEENKYPTLSELKKVTKHLKAKSSIKKLGILLPVYKAWETLAQDLYERNKEENEKVNISEDNFRSFLEDHKLFNSKLKHEPATKLHKKVKVAYSLSLVTGEGKFLQRRKSWNGEPIYQIINDADPRKGGNYYQAPNLVRQKQGGLKIEGIIQTPYKSKNIFHLSREDKGEKNGEINTTKINTTKIDTTKWFDIKIDNIPQELKILGIKELSYRIDDTTRPSVKFKVSSDDNLWNIIKELNKKDKKDKNNKEHLQYINPKNKQGVDKEKATAEYSKLVENYNNKMKDYKSGKSNKEPETPKSNQQFFIDKRQQFINNHARVKDGREVIWKASGWNAQINEVLLPLIEKKIPS